MRREGVAPDQEDVSMRRRLVWGLTALATALTFPIPASSGTPTDVAPEIHFAGIDRSAADGSGPISIPRLVRPGSDRRPDGGSRGGATRPAASPLAPVVAVPAFDGVPDQTGNPVSPPDPTGALGVDYHLAAVNVRMAFFDRTGAALDPPRLLENLDVALPGAAESFDPKVVYDPYRQHFVLVFLSATDTQTFISVVVIPEGSEDTTNDWCVLHMSGDQVGSNGKQFADYPMVGFTQDRVTLTTNQFDFSRAPLIGGFEYAQILSIRKVHLYDCSVDPVPIKIFSRNQTRDPDGSRAFTIVPAVSFGGSPSVQYMTSMDFNGSTGKLILWRLRAVDGVLRLGRAHVAGGPMTYPRWGRQCPGNPPGLNDNWDTGDLRLTSSFWDGDRGRLYTTTARDGNVGGGATESVIRWWEVDPAVALGDSDVTRTGTIGAVGRDLAWPSIATDGDGKIWVNYARAGAAECLAAYASVVEPGTSGSSAVLIKPGFGRYEFSSGIVERWGDYTAVSRDPVTPTQVATYGAYPFDDGGGTQTRLWRQVIASVEDT
jgi:hypothetical protein